MDRFSENYTDQHGPPGVNLPPEDESGFRKEREPKDDGRYIIFYTFEGEDDREGGES